MTFCSHHLKIVASAGNFTLWHYHTSDKKQEILKNDYFEKACCIKNGDILIIENNNNEEKINIQLYALTDKKPIALLQ